jgi:ketosteroid isomerase-like protein
VSSTETGILTSVLDQWKSAVEAHDPARAASYFTGDAIFQGLHPYSIGPDGVAAYYDSQPIGMTADYAVLETRRLSDDLVLGYLSVDFGFPARPSLRVYLSIIVHRAGGTWLISHYQVSRLTDSAHDH